MTKVPELSIFFPFWNEEKNIVSVVEKAIEVAPNVAEKWEILMIDDGSSDGTLGIARDLEKKHKNLRAISHMPNRGYGAALREGFTNSRFDLVVFNDGDGQFEFSEVNKFIDKIDEADIVIGFRRKRFDHPFRHILMNLLKIWDFMFFGFYFKDIDCGFKFFRKSALDKIFPLRSEGAMITTEILAKAKKAKLRIEQVGVSHFPRKYGDQSGGNARVILRAIIETFKVWYSIRKT